MTYTQSLDFRFNKTLKTLLFGFLLLFLSGKVRIFFPFTPIPFTLQTAAVLFLGACFGKKLASLSVFSYLAVGFTDILFNPAVGFLFGFLAAAYTVGFLTEKVEKMNSFKLFLILGLGNVIIHFFGICGAVFFLGGWERAFLLASLPFIAGDIVKIFLVMGFMSWKKSFS